MSKFNPNKPKIAKEIGQAVVDNGEYLGYSVPIKDCYWGCFLYEGKFYISLNNEGDSVWEADIYDIEDYCDTTTNVYDKLIAQEKEKEKYGR